MPRDIEQKGAVASVLAAFEHADVVCIGEPHGMQDLSAFLGELIRHPSFAETVNDIVVECGNSLYQETADRFTAGKDVPASDLLRIWRDTTQPGTWDAPMYGQVFVRVREANSSLPPGQRIRIVLADEPIDWNRIGTPSELAPFAALREAHFAAAIETQVLRKGRKALFWAGSSHVVRKPENVPNAVVLLEKRHAGRFFIVLTHSGFADEALETRLAAWPVPSLLRLENSWLGHLDAATYFHEVKAVRSRNPYAGVRLHEAADAYLFLGTRESLDWAAAPEDIYEGEYGAELARRRKLLSGLAGIFRSR